MAYNSKISQSSTTISLWIMFSTLMRADCSLPMRRSSDISRRSTIERAVSFFCALRRRGMRRRSVDFSFTWEDQYCQVEIDGVYRLW